MAKETNWHKHVAIGTYILIGLTIILGVLTFTHPPDPAHPMSLDFLSKSIVLPPWLALLIIILVIAVTFWLARRPMRAPRPIHIPPDQLSVIDIPTGRPQSGTFAQATARPPSGNPVDLVLSPSDDFSVRVQRHVWQQTKGLILTISNERLSSIKGCKITFYSAQSFDANHNDYRESSIKPFVIQRPEPIQSGHSGKAAWFVRRETEARELGLTDLFVGEDNRNILTWPPNDPATIHKWEFSLSVFAETTATPEKPSKPLDLITARVAIAWDTQKQDFNLVSIRAFKPPV